MIKAGDKIEMTSGLDGSRRVCDVIRSNAFDTLLSGPDGNVTEVYTRSIVDAMMTGAVNKL